MMVHITVLILISLLGIVIYRKKPNKRRNIQFTILSMFIIFLVQALRGNIVGWDTAAYLRGFNSFRNNTYFVTTVSSWEPLFIVLNKAIAIFTENAQWLLAVSSLIIVSGIGYFIAENTNETDSAFWPVFFFCCMDQYFSTMNLIRQSIAMAIGINIYTVLSKDSSKKGIIKSFILFCVAMLFHNSAFICLALFLPFLLKEVNRKIVALSGISSVIALLFFSNLMKIFFTIFPQYTKYIESFRYEGKEISKSFWILVIVKIIMIGLIFTLNSRHKGNKQLYRLAFITMLSIGMTMLQTKITLAVRLGYYFEIFIILLIPQFVNKLKGIKVQIYIFLFVIGWSYFIYLLTTGGARGCVPYYFFWQ